MRENNSVASVDGSVVGETDMEIEDLEKRCSELALCESQPELESQRLRPREANHWDDQAQRQKINLRGKFEMENRHHQECHTSCREIGE